MREARDRSQRRALCTSAILALGLHGLLLWSAPSSSSDQAAVDGPLVLLEIESGSARAKLAKPQPTAAPATEPAMARARVSESVTPRPRPSHARRPRQSGDAPREAPVAAVCSAAPSPSQLAMATGELDQALPHDRGFAELTQVDGGLTGTARVLRTSAATHASSAAVSGDAPAGRRAGVPAAPTHELADVQAPATLLRSPRLLTTRNPCAGYFPVSSQLKHGQVQLDIDVDEQGNTYSSETLLELPTSQGFAVAAKACASQLHFAPALDAHGHPVHAHTRIQLRFDRG